MPWSRYICLKMYTKPYFSCLYIHRLIINSNEMVIDYFEIENS